MLNLFDHYDQASWDLHFSLLSSGYDNPTVVIEDDGFLPHDVTSPIQYFTGFTEIIGEPLYFNQLEIPEYCEIRANSNEGEIFNLHRKIGHIYFDKKQNNRFIKQVDWYDELGRVRFKDRYNNSGYRFAQTTITEEGQEIQTSYFDRYNKEVIVEKHLTRDIILNYNDKVIIFKNKQDFILYYLKEANYHLDRLFYNSLSIPLFVAMKLPKEGNDILFWNEPIGEQLPGNMVELIETSYRNIKIFVQDKAIYDKILGIIDDKYKSIFQYLGYLYPFKRVNEGRKDVLTLTNSDQLEHLDSIVANNPKLTFHIAAITEMSEHLLSYGSHPNVKLYPQVTSEKIKYLFSLCDLYLDINHGNEIPGSVRAAFENRMLILAFTNTCHNQRYIAAKNTFEPHEISQMNTVLEMLSRNKANFKELLKYQREDSGVSTKFQYRQSIS